VSAAERPHRSELVDRCECGTAIDHRGECTNLDCIEYERAVHGPIRYEVQFGWGAVHCATFRRAIEAYEPGWCRVVRAGHISVDCDDDGLTDDERFAVELGDCDARDALVAVIDGNAAKAA
jgi:hypothetical protein